MLEAPSVKAAFIGIRESLVGFEGLTDRGHEIAAMVGDGAELSRPTLEDIMYFTAKGEKGYAAAIMLMTFSATLDAKNKSMIVIASLPVSSKSIVQAKYAAVLLFTLIGIVASVSVYAINRTIVGRDMVYAPSFIPIIFFIIALYASLYYPIYYWFGFRASQIVGMVAVALPVTFLLALGGVSSSADTLNFPAAASAAFLAVGGLLLIISYRLSLFFLEKKGAA
ncbi:ABC-2 transporter permease [Paenibacillus sp. FSL H8-0537]|uniref:ABC-2 transporter permease n=1 Tax=Paenibacillus sp. FSL H8-0537 TaxID=2921399 RepID=UPI00310180C2